MNGINPFDSYEERIHDLEDTNHVLRSVVQVATQLCHQLLDCPHLPDGHKVQIASVLCLSVFVLDETASSDLEDTE